MFNVQGLITKTSVSKVPFIKDILNQNNQLFIHLTESWLYNHKLAELQIPGYKSFQSDRDRVNRSQRGRFSGGVISYVRNDLAASINPLFSFSNGVVEVLCLFSKLENLLLINLYRQPDNQVHRSTHTHFKQALDELSKYIVNLGSPCPDIIFTGDFNLPHIDWVSCKSVQGIPTIERLCFNVLSLFMQEHFLSQCILNATHFQGNILDLVFTNNTDLIFDYKCIETLRSVSHHKIIEVETKFMLKTEQPVVSEKPTESNPFSSLNFHDDNVDWSSLSDELSDIDWNLEFRKLSVDQMAERLIDISSHCALNHVPVKSKNVANKAKKIPRTRRLLMARRGRINKILLHITSPARKKKLREELIDIEKKLHNSYKESREFKETMAVKNIKKNAKFFYAFAKQFSKVKSHVGPLKENDCLITDDREMADILASQFSSVYTSTSETLPSPEALFDDSSTVFNDFNFNEDDMIEALETLKPFSSSRPDGFPSIYLKRCKLAFAKPLCILWKKSLAEGHIPSCFKSSDVIPLFKKGGVGDKENYRPITNSSHLLKVFEKVIRKFMVQYLEENNLFNPNQHGFRQKRSCLSQLLAHYEEILCQLEDGLGIDVAYLDFSKAFDKVDFHILLKKIKSLGIGGKLGRWLYDFLTNRSQTVIVNGIKSKRIFVTSGVPQGSVLGPLLFLILIGDIDKDVQHSFVSSFADDTRAFKSVFSMSDVSFLQSDLNTIYLWAEQNNMFFNSVKFEMLRYNTPSPLSNAAYKDNHDQNISIKKSLTDLGVIMSSSANFSEQIEKVASSMKNMISWVLRTFQLRNRFALVTLWKSLILPIHDYCSQLWSPHKLGDIQRFELLQWYFLKKIKHVNDNDYWDALKSFNMLSLQRRRERYQIIYVWKIIEGIVPNPVMSSAHSKNNFIDFSISQRLGRTCKVPGLKSQSSCYIKNIRFNSFHVHSCRLFNCLPIDIRNLDNVTVEFFKSKLDIYLSDIPDCPHLPGLRKFCPLSSNSLIEMVPYYRQSLIN